MLKKAYHVPENIDPEWQKPRYSRKKNIVFKRKGEKIRYLGKKEHITYKGNQIKLSLDFFFDSKAFCQKKLDNVFKIFKERKCELRIFLSRNSQTANNMLRLWEYYSQEPFLRSLLRNKFQTGITGEY